MRDVMVDLETLGTVPGCVILSIGAVAFDENATTSRASTLPFTARRARMPSFP
jgi:DNA polymerase III epsilon subunit-like protein